MLSFIGAYSVSNSMANVWVAFGAGIFGYFARRLGFPIIGLMLGIILGPMIEERLRQTLSIGRGDITIILDRPISFGLFIVICLIIAGSIWAARNRRGADV